MIKEIAKNFKNYSIKQGWTQQEAANKIGCSVQHVNRIFNGKCLPSAVLAAKMENVMGKPEKSSLEECMEKYPIGAKIIEPFCGINVIPEDNFEEYGSKDYNKIIEGLKTEGYLLGLNDCTYNILFYIPKKGFFFQEFLLTSVSGYQTFDGYIFEPFFKIGITNDVRVCTLKDVLVEENYLDDPFTLVKKDFSNIEEVIRQIFNNYNKVNKTNYIPCFCKEDYEKVLKADEE